MLHASTKQGRQYATPVTIYGHLVGYVMRIIRLTNANANDSHIG
jgi:hypothetical protein